MGIKTFLEIFSTSHRIHVGSDSFLQREQISLAHVCWSFVNKRKLFGLNLSSEPKLSSKLSLPSLWRKLPNILFLINSQEGDVNWVLPRMRRINRGKLRDIQNPHWINICERTIRRQLWLENEILLTKIPCFLCFIIVVTKCIDKSEKFTFLSRGGARAEKHVIKINFCLSAQVNVISSRNFHKWSKWLK